jgi:hypothetical protein
MVIQSNFRQICRDPAVALCVHSCIVPDGRANVIDDPRGLVSGSVCKMLDFHLAFNEIPGRIEQIPSI